FLLASLGAAVGVLGMYWPGSKRLPFLVRAAGYAFTATVAGVLAWVQVLRSSPQSAWEPTRR
ncbi:MAG TPA: hypothetical protein VHE78_11080, partial [Gemmatimonadaceae bacterium]|nr:hypothetical protein [Gemmatimonadaceae bacterium]